MKTVKILHNPTAGEGDTVKSELLSLIKRAGFKSSYASTKSNGWEDFEDDKVDLFVVVGGDGTVRKVVKGFLDNAYRKLPIALLPTGTANNIAKALNINKNYEEQILKLGHESYRKFDIGRVSGLTEESFFMEGMGFGPFASLIADMKNMDNKPDDPDNKMALALQTLANIIRTCPVRHYKLIIDDVNLSNDYLLVEILNIQAVGPNLLLSPHGEPGDGRLEVILIKEAQRNQFANYVINGCKTKEALQLFNPIMAKRIEIQCAERAHVDDELVEMDSEKSIEIEVVEGFLEFLV